ncbi:maleylpyruvate isomerase family mycothiol-dependent enzyme [Actinoplanes derwentensis]|uniref:TIGR03083 family protein n=1 Tax=Actinoplanes derwentensis TaxID=113562 RepID=A0A1H1WV38_9ACTN|nr:maleylpyruvate isomerase family mycothiol-dependent enzyme [Actinoplanes derwentensis]GID86958.1 maleylpyruvate isomerase [Actinoplanes derwentensis]SDT01148.1 TIGR03083 family protein [Actinoplanes derwentensis]
MSALRAEASAFGAVLESLTAAEWELPTRCAPWLVRDLAGHVITVLSRVPVMIAAPAPSAPDTTAAGYYRADKRFSETANTERVRTAQARAVSPAEFAATVAAMLHAVDGAAADRVVVTRHGDAMLLTDFLTTRVVELAVHGLDVADALGRPAWITPQAAAVVLDLLFGPDRQSAITGLGADPETVLRRATGRAPVTPAESGRLTEAGLRRLTLG